MGDSVAQEQFGQPAAAVKVGKGGLGELARVEQRGGLERRWFFRMTQFTPRA